jgi:hypothetical protein
LPRLSAVIPAAVPFQVGAELSLACRGFLLQP